jgi:Flp pilus assembly protein TadD
MESTATLKWLGESCDAAPPAAAKPAAPISSPEDANRYYRLGKQQTAAQDYWAALKSLNRAIELSPERAEFYNARGYAYLLLKSYANAVVDFSDAIRLRSGYANAYRNRAVARRHSGDEQGAADDERKAAEIPQLK